MIITDIRPQWPVADRRVRLPFLDLRGDSAFAQLIRFAAVGGLSNIVYFLAFVTLRDGGAQAANVVGVIASTALANELHRRVTFRAADRVKWYVVQVEGGGLALAGLIASSAALAAVQLSFPGAGAATLAGLVIAVSAAVGGVRFLALRGWVF
ncbi:GtrA family protein [Antrihabitans sp. YC2-6]|uniref:GtrA family protein n=1 Tax=Antrihabitans sp. YC2-6 TaxID=2799498 RepID=UPI0018F367FC|nr:GtrA family protein [Antrihabitans sp. YC2-6]MBJ8345548.1 GtrA family protein [Antrihabitans sp. YC2-6]